MPPGWDVIIVGGGPAGLSCALILARSRRRVLVLDAGGQRNQVSLEQHAVLGADGCNREQYLKQAREQVLAYPTVDYRQLEVVDVRALTDDGSQQGDPCSVLSTDSDGSLPSEGGGPASDRESNGWQSKKTECFEAVTADGASWVGRKMVLATGMHDVMPEVEGFQELFGRGIWTCLYCDGYEYSDLAIAAYGNGERGTHLALEMLLLSKNVTLLTDGEELEATAKERELLKRRGVRVLTAKLARALSGDDGQLAGVELQDGQRIMLRGLFFNTGRRQKAGLPVRMGLPLDDKGDIECDLASGRVPNIHGLFVAGNNAKAQLQLIMTAASQGAIVGAKVNSEMMYEDLGLVDGSNGYLDEERT